MRELHSFEMTNHNLETDSASKKLPGQPDRFRNHTIVHPPAQAKWRAGRLPLWWMPPGVDFSLTTSRLREPVFVKHPPSKLPPQESNPSHARALPRRAATPCFTPAPKRQPTPPGRSGTPLLLCLAAARTPARPKNLQGTLKTAPRNPQIQLDKMRCIY
jgi:hypothetical protein